MYILHSYLLQNVLEVMKSLEKVFKASYLKGDGKAPSHTPEVAALHTAAISGWSLLLSLVPASAITDFANRFVYIKCSSYALFDL